jgi:hypothetical protein
VNRFALGPANGNRDFRINANATGCAGIRTPTVPKPAVTSFGTRLAFGKTSVNGPGQYRAASFSAASGHSATTRFAIATLETCTINGLVDGRPLAS